MFTIHFTTDKNGQFSFQGERTQILDTVKVIASGLQARQVITVQLDYDTQQSVLRVNAVFGLEALVTAMCENLFLGS